MVDQGGFGEGEDTSSSIASLIASAGYAPQSAQDNTTMSKVGATSVLGKVTIAQLDGTGEPIETWTLVNAWINDVKFGDLAYDGDELTEVTISIKYDWAELESSGNRIFKRGV
jgi:hypothetical protein